MSRARVQVLLSTYNGEKFLLSQLESLRAQEGVDVQVLVRDDASLDSTPELLQARVGGDLDLRFVSEGNSKNLGVIQSFFELLKASDPAADFYAFCDQDDVWLPAKLRMAAHALGRADDTEPALYFGRLRYVDEDLAPLGLSRLPKRLSFESALVENVATGCSVVFNRALRDALMRSLPEKNCLMHDWWAYLTAQALGRVVYDPEPLVLYRQHVQNVVGASASFWRIYLTKLRRFKERGARAPHVSDQAAEFLRCHGPVLSPERRALIEEFLASKQRSWPARLVYALRLPLKRQSALDNIIFRILIFLGRY